MTRHLHIALTIMGMMVAAAVMLVCAWASIEYSSGHDPLSIMRGSSVRIMGEGNLYGPARDQDARQADSDQDGELPTEQGDAFTRMTSTLPKALADKAP